MRFAQDDDVIETLLSDRADHPLDERILPGTRGRGQDLGDAHTRHAALEGCAVNPIAVPVKPARCRVLRKSLDHLWRSPRSFKRQLPFRESACKRPPFGESGVTRLVRRSSESRSIESIDLLERPQCANPQWSPDGRTILFNSRRTGSSDLYLLQPETGTLTQLTNDPSEEAEARWSRDGRSIYFGSNRTGRLEVWRVPATGGAAAQVTRRGGLAAIEPDDGFIYYSKDAQSPTSIWRVPVEGGSEVPLVDGLSYSLNFAVSRQGLYFIALNGTPDQASVDFFDFSTRQRSTLVRLDKRFWLGITLSPDEQSLVFPLVDSAGSHLMLVGSFR